MGGGGSGDGGGDGDGGGCGVVAALSASVAVVTRGKSPCSACWYISFISDTRFCSVSKSHSVDPPVTVFFTHAPT